MQREADTELPTSVGKIPNHHGCIVREGVLIFDHLLSILHGLTMKAKKGCQTPPIGNDGQPTGQDVTDDEGMGSLGNHDTTTAMEEELVHDTLDLTMLPKVYLYTVFRPTMTAENLITGAYMAISPADGNTEHCDTITEFLWLFIDVQKGVFWSAQVTEQ